MFELWNRQNSKFKIVYKKLDISWKSYSKTLSLSKEIYLDVFGEPKTHAEWADSFNKIGRINRLIIKHANGEIRE